MAYCPKCSAEVPDGASFCTNCGAQIIISPQQQPIAPVEPAPAAEPPVREEPVPSPVENDGTVKKKKKTWLIWLIVGLVVVGAVLAVLFITGVLGGSAEPPTLLGTWTLSDSTASDVAPGDIVLTFSEDGAGSANIKGTVSPLTWTEDSLILNGFTVPIHLDGENLVVEDEGADYIFVRSAAEPAAGGGGGAFGGGGAQPTPGEEPSPAAESSSPLFPVAPTPEPTPEPKANPNEGLSFPFGTWTGAYVYNTNFFQTKIVLTEDYNCRRVIIKNGEVVKDETGFFEYSDGEIRLYTSGDHNTWTAYAVTGEMMVNNNHEFFRTHPGGMIGAWVGDYVYNGNNIHSTYILRTDGTYSEVTTRNGEVVTDEDGTWTFDGKTLTLRSNNNTGFVTPFDYNEATDILVNNNFDYIHVDFPS